MQLFDKVKELRGVSTIIEQCEVICGDCTLPDLGISIADRKILAENVSIIYHCAATIRFDEELKTAVLLNTRGTKLMLELAENCPRLEVSLRAFNPWLSVKSITYFALRLCR